jgi:hypothetical protein
MFGEHSIPLKIETEGLSLVLEKEGDNLVYKRDCLGNEEEKTLLTGKEEILLNPVEPLHTPKKLTSYLMIAFEDELVVEPKASKKVFVTFPVEIGVFLKALKKFDLLDVVSLVKSKFTLYGTPRGGSICKYWHSAVHFAVPAVNIFHEGVMSLRIKNETDRWETVTKVVLNGYGMKIHFNETIASTKAEMKIIDRGLAETEFVGSPMEKGMTKAQETYVSGMISMEPTRFVMNEGI